jgi:hypothetical protein
MELNLATRLNTNAMLAASAVATLLALVLGFALAGVWLGVVLAAGIVGAWLLGRRNPQLREASADMGLIAVFTLTAAGMLVLAPPLLMALAGAAALLCWSFMRAELRVAAVKRVDGGDAMAQGHLRAALVACAAGLAIAGLAVLIRTNITFAAIFFAGLLAALLLSAVMGRWRREKT